MNAPAKRFDPAPAAAPRPRTSEDVVRMMREPQRLLDVGEERIAYWRFGDGPDLVFVHGWPVHAATFRHLLPTLSRHFTCHLIDLPGAGQTRSPTFGPVTLGGHARVVGEVIEQLGLHDYALLAHDSGAVVARIVAARHGSRVRGLVVGNSEIPGHRPWLVVMYTLLGKIPGALSLVRWSLRSAAVRRSFLAFGGCFSDPVYLSTDFHELFVAPMLDSYEAYRGQMRLVLGLDFAEIDNLDQVHREITAPTLLVWGTDDPFFPVQRARTMPEQFGGTATLHEIPGAKLFAHEDHPEAFLAPSVPFLRACFEQRASTSPASAAC